MTKGPQTTVTPLTIPSLPEDVAPVGFPPVAATLRAAVERIVQVLRPQKVVLFGSYAYGKPTPDSDVDLLIIMETEASPIERYLQVSALLRPRPFPVDILVKTPAEIEAALQQPYSWVREILEQGIVLYERE